MGLKCKINEIYDRDNPKQQWDMFASVKFRGPTYPYPGNESADCAFVDRVVLVKVTDAGEKIDLDE